MDELPIENAGNPRPSSYAVKKTQEVLRSGVFTTLIDRRSPPLNTMCSQHGMMRQKTNAPVAMSVRGEVRRSDRREPFENDNPSEDSSDPPEEFAKYIASEGANWKRIVAAITATAE